MLVDLVGTRGFYSNKNRNLFLKTNAKETTEYYCSPTLAGLVGVKNRTDNICSKDVETEKDKGVCISQTISEDSFRVIMEYRVSKMPSGVSRET